MLNFPLSEELVSTFSKAKGGSIRFLKIEIRDEKFELKSTGNSSSTSLDFNSFQKSLTPDELCFIAFRWKESYQENPWALILYSPDGASVKDRMMYGSSFVPLRDSLGSKFFGKLKRYSSPSEFVWNDFQNSESDQIGEEDSSSTVKKPSNPNANLPWNKREIALQQLDKEDAQARQEFEQFAKEKTPTQASGFSQVTFPLTPTAVDAIKGVESGAHNWIQLSLNEPPSHVDLVTSKNISPSELSSSLDPEQPQFYLYYSDSIPVLIYCCPEKSSGNFKDKIKKKMVYSTCKGPLAKDIKELGLSNLKKFDVQDPSELTQDTLRAHLRSKAAGIFSGAELKPVTGSPSPYRQGNNKPTTKHKIAPEGSLAGLMANTGTSRKLPKGVVIPPPGAYQ